MTKGVDDMVKYKGGRRVSQGQGGVGTVVNSNNNKKQSSVGLPRLYHCRRKKIFRYVTNSKTLTKYINMTMIIQSTYTCLFTYTYMSKILSKESEFRVYKE